jgi:oxygen-independent coproporphyrinogen-3 oxidase
MGASYSQNARTLLEYYALLDRGQLPVVRGIELERDDLVRRSVIHKLMCNFELAMETIEVLYLLDFERYFAPEMAELEQLAELGLVRTDARAITVSPKGRMLIRNVCMVFDRYLRLDTGSVRYSRTI